ncbi:hypothetical protein GCM10009128_23760 [Psychrosphaera haliotis]|uniref:hypothetical protein n=1 Tax=Psychrosphaera haliotis TaxID=555083 RepID=UPI0031E0FE13
MAKLPDGFEKEYLSLLQPITSEETIKNRRNLFVASFVILSVYSLGKSLTDVKVLGLNLQGSNANALFILAIAILIFWTFMFVIHAVKDFEINQERKYLLDAHVDSVKSRIENMREKVDITHSSYEFSSAKGQLAIYQNQQDRIKKALKLSKLTFIIEYGLPILLALISLCLIINNAYNVWSFSP